MNARFAHALDDGVDEYMTPQGCWHRHWHVLVESRDTRWVRLLRAPLLHVRNLDRVEASPYPYGPCPKRPENGGVCPGHRDCWTLSTLAILHRWTGLTLYFPEKAGEG